MPIKKLQGPKETAARCHYEYDTDSKPVGEGGMGAVYLGYLVDETTGVRSEVAIKVMHTDLPDEVYARAEREASIQLRHDNLVEMYGFISEIETDTFGAQNLRHYVISEFLHGLELSAVLAGEFVEDNNIEDHQFAKQLYFRYIKDRKSTSVEILRNIAMGLMALHNKGYVHRDIDPSNIMVTNDGHIKLIDFGIAKNLHSLGSKDRLTTATGKFMGKAEYASPELVLGDVKNQNFTTDIYALGILLYRLLVGELPFRGTSYEVLQMQLKKKVPSRDIHDYKLACIVRKATQKRQSDRYQTVAQYLVDLDQAESRPSRFDPRVLQRVVMALAVMGAAALIYLIIGWIAHSDNTPPPTAANPSMRGRFVAALGYLDSGIPHDVSMGLDSMRVLAKEGYDSARVELGLTYFTYRAKNEKSWNPRSPLIEQRRTMLGLEDVSDAQADSTIHYLSQVAQKAPEVNMILSFTYINRHKREGLDSALYYIDRTLDDLARDEHVGHGYKKAELAAEAKNIKKVLSDTKRQISNR